MSQSNRIVNAEAMMIMMADYNGLQTGTTVRCKTCYGLEITGEVSAFDLSLKSLILSCPSSSGDSGKKNVHMLNITQLENMEVLEEAKSEETPLPGLDLNKLNRRVKKNAMIKLSKVNSVGVGVTPEAQDLFNSIRKTIDETAWEGSTIVVFNTVEIVPPYSENDLKTRKGVLPDTREHILKIVRKHYADKQSLQSS